MATSSDTRRARPSHPPLWLVEGLDIVQRKRLVLGAVVIVVVALGALASLVFPDTIPATAGVGAAVGVAALLLGLAAAVASDATELIVRGPRHVAAAGGELVAVLPRDPSVAAAGPLAAAVEEVREPGVPLLLAFATAGRDARRTVAWTDAIARSLVSRDLGVLRVDLASGRSEEPGLVEVVRDGTRLADVVEFEPGVKLARLLAGRDHSEALDALTELPSRLPRDLDILLVSLPTAVSRPVVAAAAALDHVLVVVERDRTSRVDLIASLDALEAAGTDAQVVLLDTSTALRLSPPVEADPEVAPAKRGIASTLGMSPRVQPGSDGEPVEVSDEPVETGDEPVETGDAPVAVNEEPVEAADATLVAGHAPSGESEQAVDEDPAVVGDAEIAVDDAEGSAAHDDHALAAQDPDARPEQGSDEDLDQGAPRRDVDLLEAAAAATALAITESEQEPLDERFERLPEEDQTAALEELPQPDAEPRVETAVDLTAATESADQGHSDLTAAPPRHPEDTPDATAQDDTDRIPRVGGADSPRFDRAEPEEEDMLRTTAQLAILNQDIDLRDAPEDADQDRLSDPGAPRGAVSTDTETGTAADTPSAASRARDIVREVAGDVEEASDARDDERQ